MKIEIIDTIQSNSHYLNVEMIINDKILMTKKICKNEICDFLDYYVDFDNGDSLHFSRFTDDDTVATEFTDEEIQDYLNNTLIITE